VLDYHLHLWPHGEKATGPALEQVAAYCERAAKAGVEEVALTEHLFRFVQADRALRGFWDDDPMADPTLRSRMAAYWDDHMGADLDRYMEVAILAKQAGLPVVTGLEVDYYQGRMDKVAEVLAGYPFDVLLGSVHWLGAWLFDWLEDGPSMAEWDLRGTEAAWDAYTSALEELAASGVCDVLAHPDLAKVAGYRPRAPLEHYDRMAEAAARSGMAAEVSSAGWRKPAAEAYPAPELLSRFFERGVPITTASDAHRLGEVAHRADELRALVVRAGYHELCGFRGRKPHPMPVALAPGVKVGS
jgi:histidinol-phosphatase (PHP family)